MSFSLHFIRKNLCDANTDDTIHVSKSEEHDKKYVL